MKTEYRCQLARGVRVDAGGDAIEHLSIRPPELARPFGEEGALDLARWRVIGRRRLLEGAPALLVHLPYPSSGPTSESVLADLDDVLGRPRLW